MSAGKLAEMVRALAHEVPASRREHVIHVAVDVWRLEEDLKREKASYGRLLKQWVAISLFVQRLLREAERHWPGEKLPFKDECRKALRKAGVKP